MDKKEKENKKTNNKKRKANSKKIYALCFPFHINIKIINSQDLILDLLNKTQNKNHFSQILKTLYFGLNTCLKYIQNNNYSDNEKMIFIFYNKQMESLYDLILFRSKNDFNIHIYFIDENWQKNFIDKFRLKKLLSFIIIKNEINKDIFNEIKSVIESYDINKENNKIITKNSIQETIVEFNN